MTPAQQLARQKHADRAGPVGPLACRVREYRQAVGLSLRDVAGAVGLSVVWVHQIERGKAPSLAVARKLAEFFGKSVDDLWPPVADRPPGDRASTGGEGPPAA